jgi:hypothetical protein
MALLLWVAPVKSQFDTNKMTFHKNENRLSMGKTRPSRNQISGHRRKRESLLPLRRSTRSKPVKPTEAYTIDKTWVSASTVRNYLLRDPLQDWLNEYGNPLVESTTTSSQVPSSSPIVNLTTFLQDQGTEFEKRLIPRLFHKFGPQVIRDIGGSHGNCTLAKFAETCTALREGVPIIYSGVLHDAESKMYGVPDLIVRSDWLGRLVSRNPLTPEEAHHPAPHLKGPYHYRIVDIKFATLYLRADGTHLLNQESIPAYKGQVWVYNTILAKIQGYDPGVAYLLGRRWKYSTRGNDYRGNNCLDRLGVVDFREGRVDAEYVDRSQKAIAWVREMRQDGANWNVTQEPLTRPELYPNMSNRADYPWRPVKEALAKGIGEITLLWQCGPKHRQMAHEAGVYRWDDPECTVETVGMTGDHRCRVLSQILKVNQQDKILVWPKTIKNNGRGWQQRRPLEFFVDFETVNDIIDTFSTLPESNTLSQIFMIGVGYFDPETSDWVYCNFTVKSLTSSEESRICREFSQLVDRMCSKYEFTDPILVHWSRAELNMWEAAAERHPRDTHWVKTSQYWFDLYKVFEDEPIVVQGCLSFGLKEVAKAFHRHGLIETIWDTSSSCQNGASAMVIADVANREARQRGISMTEIPLIQEMMKYNEVDCKVMAEIMTYLRKHHVRAEPMAKRLKSVKRKRK